MRKTNAAGVALIKRWEGLRLEAYRDAVGVLTIGYGHTQNVTSGQKITEAQAEQLLKEDLTRFEKYVDRPEWNWLNDNQFSALVSLAFNVGSFGTGLITALNNKDPQRVTERMALYNKAGGIYFQGLANRRQSEIELFNTPTEKKNSWMKSAALFAALFVITRK